MKLYTWEAAKHSKDAVNDKNSTRTQHRKTIAVRRKNHTGWKGAPGVEQSMTCSTHRTGTGRELSTPDIDKRTASNHNDNAESKHTQQRQTKNATKTVELLAPAPLWLRTDAKWLRDANPQWGVPKDHPNHEQARPDAQSTK